MASSIPESYTPAQLSAYLSHISFSPPLAQGPDLTYLTVLQARQVARVPFEDLSLHYSPTHTISLDPVVLFDKIVHRGRGGYCMENNMLFGQMLAALGYDVYFAGARISERLTGSRGAEAQDFGGWSHMVNIVTIQNMRYVVDVGFGAGGSIRPMPLVDGAESQGLGTQMLRLAYRRLRQHRDPTQRAWVLETRGEDENGEEWKPIYAFTTVEFLPSDFSVMNLATSTLRTSWFTYTVVCARMLLSEAGDEVIGNLTLVNRDLKRNIRGKKELLVTCQSEEERLAVLEEHFGIVLREDERGGIAGLGTALR
ncbi:MAG: N-terminal acetyltransferase [Thelocarpon impressellum]|nr:MAG: N-terminal acetyltransferase [Thelocarpon impressellum]